MQTGSNQLASDQCRTTTTTLHLEEKGLLSALMLFSYFGFPVREGTIVILNQNASFCEMSSYGT